MRRGHSYNGECGHCVKRGSHPYTWSKATPRWRYQSTIQVVPVHLRHCGRLRNRRLPKAEVEQAVRRVWRATEQHGCTAAEAAGAGGTSWAQALGLRPRARARPGIWARRIWCISER